MTVLVPFSKAMPHLKEADVLLFRGEGLISWAIKRYSSGIHSHAGMVHRDGEHIQCVEFREFKGGRSVSLKTQVESHPDTIDVFRVIDGLWYDSFAMSELAGDITGKISMEFTDEIAKKVTGTMMDLTGLPYGWKNFWKLAKHYAPFFRLAEQNVKDAAPSDVFVCSTAVAFAYRSAYHDPVPYLSDSSVSPADLARSALFKYQFTLQKDW
jgi:hypothetical protein